MIEAISFLVGIHYALAILFLLTLCFCLLLEHLLIKIKKSKHLFPILIFLFAFHLSFLIYSYLRLIKEPFLLIFLFFNDALSAKCSKVICKAGLNRLFSICTMLLIDTLQSQNNFNSLLKHMLVLFHLK